MSELRNDSETIRATFRKLSGKGHDEWEASGLEAIQSEFDQLMKNGYALFVNETQVHNLAAAQAAFLEMGGEHSMVVTAVPALRGGSH